MGTVLAWVGEPGEEISAADEKVIHHHEPHETPDIESIIDEPVLQGCRQERGAGLYLAGCGSTGA